MEAVLNLLAKIPSSFWGVLVGAAISIVSVILNNRSTNLRLERQLAHDREQTLDDRDFAIRRDVYLDATEAIATGLAEIGNFANFELPPTQLMSRYSARAPSIAKTHVIARSHAFKAILNLLVELNAVTMELLAKRIPVAAKKGEVQHAEAHLSKLLEEQNQILELMRQNTLSPSPPDGQMETLNEHFRLNQELMSENEARRGPLSREWVLMQLSYMQECTLALSRLNLLLAPALAAVRSELKLTIDESEIRSLLDGTSERINSEIAKFVENLAASSRGPDSGDGL